MVFSLPAVTQPAWFIVVECENCKKNFGLCFVFFQGVATQRKQRDMPTLVVIAKSEWKVFLEK